MVPTATHRVPPLKVLYRPEGVFVYTMLQYMWHPLLPKMPQTLMVGNMRVSPKWTTSVNHFWTPPRGAVPFVYKTPLRGLMGAAQYLMPGCTSAAGSN